MDIINYPVISFKINSWILAGQIAPRDTPEQAPDVIIDTIHLLGFSRN